MSEQAQTQMVPRAETARIVPVGNEGNFVNWLDVDRFEHVQRIAKVFAEASLVPQQYRGKIADCIIGVQMALRLHVDPFMFLQNTYVVHGRPGMEAKLAIALVNERGPFDGPVKWKFSGEAQSDDWACTAYATHRKTGDVCEATVTWKMVKAEGWLAKDGSKWKSMPEMMFRYRSATFLARLYCPEVLMGMNTTDELEDVGRTIVIEPSKPPLADPDAFADPPRNAHDNGNANDNGGKNEAAKAPQGENSAEANPQPTGDAQASQDAQADADAEQQPTEPAAPPKRRRRQVEPAAAAEQPAQDGRKVKVYTSHKPPRDWIERLAAAGFRGSATQTTWIAPYNDEAYALAEHVADEPWCVETRYE